MYATSFNRVTDQAEIRQMVSRTAAGELISTGPDGYPEATLLPLIWHDDLLLAHMARPNTHWTRIAEGAPVLVICAGPDGYVSPSWYPSKADDGKVVPTWNYTSVHIRGTAHIHDDPEWLRDQVTRLTSHHEHHRAAPWHVTDAPSAFIDGQLRGIIGIEIKVQHVDAKAKLSQNRSAGDRAGVIEGLTNEHTPQARRLRETMQHL